MELGGGDSSSPNPPQTPPTPPIPSRHACVPVDFEEVKVSADASEDDVQNAIMAIRRNGVALKGMIWGGGGG